MRIVFRCIGWLGLAIVFAIGAVAVPRVAAQTAPAVQSDPPRDAILTAPPRRIDLSFMDLVDPTGPATIRLVAGDGRVISLGPARGDANDPRRIGAAIPTALPAGTYTVLWSAAFAPPVTATPSPDAAAGSVRTGSFAFRVAPPPAAGAAAPDGTWPAAWGVALRWLVWAGLTLATAGALLGLLGAPAARRTALVAIGGVVALLATAVQPTLLSLTAGAAGPISLGEAFGLMGAGWWATLAAAALLALVGLGALAGGGFAARPTPRLLALVPLALALVAAAGLGATARLGAAPQRDPLGLASSLIHDWSSLLLLAAVLAVPLARSAAAGGSALAWGWLARLGIAAAAIAVATGILDAGLALPSLDALGAAWGATLLAKGLLALGLVAAAAFGVSLARRQSGSGAFAFAAALGALALAASSTLALMAAPGAPASSLAQVELAAPLSGAVAGLGSTPGLVHLTLQPALPGRNATTVRLTDAAGGLPANLPAVQVRFTPLDHVAPPATLAASLDPVNGAVAGAVDLAGAGWWAVDVTVTAKGDAPVAR
ncbi:MAG TPA: copper resistance protein CopC, partial [Thermomicrobiales bacterium]|nr:copper resistance protein CopC [Thermomicrobiales bacterium]